MNRIQTRYATQEGSAAVGRMLDSYRQFYGKEPDLQAATVYIQARLKTKNR